jgi:pseudoazurin
MENSMRTTFLTVFGGIAVAAFAAPASAANHNVQMLSKGGAMVFSPALVKVAPGDTVTFLPTNPTHNAESIPGMLPPGAKPFKGAMNKPVTVRFDQAGVYGYKCLPHYGMGMVGVVVVGKAAPNLATAQKVSHPGRAKQVMQGLLAQGTR